MRREEELREAKIQQQRLNCFISQIEIYNHFMQNKTDSRPTESSMLAVGASTVEEDWGKNIDDAKPMEEEALEEASLRKKPLELQRMCSLNRKNKTSAFDDECLKFHGANSLTLEGVAESFGNMDLLNL